MHRQGLDEPKPTKQRETEEARQANLGVWRDPDLVHHARDSDGSSEHSPSRHQLTVFPEPSRPFRCKEAYTHLVNG